MAYWRDRVLTYEKGLALAKKARSKKDGKRLNARTKLKIVGDNLELLADGKRIAWIRPDDTAVLFFPKLRKGRFYGDWLGVDFLWSHNEKKTGVAHYKKWASAHPYNERSRFIVPIVDGVQFCLITGECLNPTPWPVRKNTDKAGPWRSRITKFQRTLTVMAKMGAFNHLPKEVWPEGVAYRHDRYLPLVPEEMYSLIVNENPQQLVRRLLETAGYWDWHQARRCVLDMERWPLHEFKSAYNRMRDPVRKLAGCYIEEIPHANEDAVASAA